MRDATLAKSNGDIVSRRNIETDAPGRRVFTIPGGNPLLSCLSESLISMKHRKASNWSCSVPATIRVIAGVCLCLGFVAHAQSSRIVNKTQEVVMTTHASGPFEVKLNPQTPYEASLGRMSIDKQFHGDLEATSKGEMLSIMTAVKGSAGYVAMELVSGTLHGRQGTFVLQHSATMTRGTPQLSVTVVPDSGTGQLTGLAGTMTIKIEEGGKHFYEFEYTLAETR